QLGEVITLPKVAMLVEDPNKAPNEPTQYVPYHLPRGRIPFPRDDTVKQLLALRGLQAPLKIESRDPAKTEKEVEELNQLNKSLFWQELASNPKAKTGQLQVLTNKPRSVYYIATITSAVEPTSYSYYGEVLPRALGREGSQN